MEVSKIEGITTYAVQVPQHALTEQQRTEQQKLIQAVHQVNGSQVFGESNELTFSLDRRSGKPVMKLIDRKTKEVVRQIPPEYVLRLAEEQKSA